MKIHRLPKSFLQVELLESRDVPSAKLGLGNTFAVGTDAGGVTAAAFGSNGQVLNIGPSDKITTPFMNTFHTLGADHQFQDTSGLRVAMADFNNDGVQDIAVANGPGPTGGDPSSGSYYTYVGPSEFVIYDGKTGGVIASLAPFGDFKGGLFLATGDINNDGVADLIVTPDVSGGPRVTVYSLNHFNLVGDLVPLANFFGIDDPNFRGGCRAGAGDLNGDGFDDLVISAGFGGGPRISTYSGAALVQNKLTHIVGDFFLFEQALRNGAYVAVGDVNGDGYADIVGGGGPGGAPRVLIVNGRAILNGGGDFAITVPIANFFAGDTNTRGGVRVTTKNIDGDSAADVITGLGEVGNSRQVRGYYGSDLAGGTTGNPFMNFNAFPSFTGGVFVG